MSFAFSAVSIISIEWLYYSSLSLLRRWKEHLLPRKPLATISAKALQRAAPFATGYRCDGDVRSRACGPSPNKNGNLPAYTLPARRTCSGSAANVPQRPRGCRGRAAAVATNIDRLIQAYTSEYTGRYRQIQSNTSRYEFHIKSYVAVCRAEIQADTDNRTAISDHMGMYAVPYLLPHTSRYNQIQANIRNP
jgi:hypothetical protein